jgi:hypothetical protein
VHPFLFFFAFSRAGRYASIPHERHHDRFPMAPGKQPGKAREGKSTSKKNEVGR